MTAREELASEPAYRLREMIVGKQVSPVEVTEASLARIERLDTQLNAFLTVTAERALDRARAAEQAVVRGERLGPLHGVPVSIKDLEDVDGVKITHGSLVNPEEVSKGDALCTERLEAAGAIVLGKTNTPEYGHAGTCDNRLGRSCTNPWDPARTSGGSSGGAASSVAAGMTSIAQGSDGGGSIRIPASFCGVYGIKATQGRAPRRAAGPNSWHPINTSSAGPITRTVRDAAVMLQALSGPSRDSESNTIQSDPPDFAAALARGVRGLRIAWSPDLGGAAVDSEVARTVEAAARAFEELGAHVEAAPFSVDDYEAALATFRTFFNVRAFATYGHLLEEHGELLTEYFRQNLADGRAVTGAELYRALSKLNRYRAYVREFFSRFDLLLTPTVAVPAFVVGQEPEEISGRRVHPRWGFLPFTYTFNMTGNPAASAPCGFTADGLPIGLHIVGRHEDEETVLAASAAFEEARPWVGVRPQVW